MSQGLAMKNVLLVGFGAVGAIYALVLKRSGLARVTVVARSNYDLVKAKGMTFKSKMYGQMTGWRPDRLVNSVSEAADQQYSYVFVATKAVPDVIKTSDILLPLLTSPYLEAHRQPIYVLVQNGLNVEVDLYDAIQRLGKGEPQIVSVALWIATNMLEKNVVEHGDFNRLHLGIYKRDQYTGTTPTISEEKILTELATILTAGGTEASIHSEIQRSKYSKNFWNVAFSSFATLTNYRLPALFRPPPPDGVDPYSPYVAPATAHLIESHSIPAIRALLQEVLMLGRALGFRDAEDGIPSSIVDRTIEPTRRLHIVPDSWHTPSMLADAQQGRPIEVEVIIGELVRMGKNLKVDMPRVEMLYALLLVVQNQILRKIDESRKTTMLPRVLDRRSGL